MIKRKEVNSKEVNVFNKYHYIYYTFKTKLKRKHHDFKIYEDYKNPIVLKEKGYLRNIYIDIVKIENKLRKRNIYINLELVRTNMINEYLFLINVEEV